MTVNDIKKKIFELKAARADQLAEAEAATSAGDAEGFEKAMASVKESNGLIERHEELLAQKDLFPASPVPAAAPAAKKADGFAAVLKMLRGRKLDDEELKLVQKSPMLTGDNATNGENYLIPVDMQTAIREKRKTYVSAKELVNVVRVSTLSGSINFEASAPAGLVEFDDGDTISEETPPKFVQKSWKIGQRGKIIPISRLLIDTADGLMAYINRWFLRSAIVSENEKIFSVLKAGYQSGTPKALAGWKALKKSINVDLDPSYLNGAVIATNQSGFACLDEEEDADGRPVLQPNPADVTQKLFQGLPVKVYPDAQLPNIDDTHFPLFYGATTAGADFLEYANLEFDISDDFLFNKNQRCMRVIEGFDCISTDTDAYIYASFSATASE